MSKRSDVEVLNLVRKYPGLPSRHLAARATFTEDKIRNALRTLERAGVVRSEKREAEGYNTKTAHWWVAE